MKRKTDTKLLVLAFGLIVIATVLVMLALFTLPGLAQTGADGYPAPIDEGYPIGYPIDTGYPVYDPYPVIGYPVIEPYPVEYSYPVDIGYPIIPSYPDPIGYPAGEVVSEPTFADEWQAEVIEFKQVIKQPKQVAGHDIRVTVKQLAYIIRHYGKMIFSIR